MKHTNIINYIFIGLAMLCSAQAWAEGPIGDYSGWLNPTGGHKISGSTTENFKLTQHKWINALVGDFTIDHEFKVCDAAQFVINNSSIDNENEVYINGYFGVESGAYVEFNNVKVYIDNNFVVAKECNVTFNNCDIYIKGSGRLIAYGGVEINNKSNAKRTIEAKAKETRKDDAICVPTGILTIEGGKSGIEMTMNDVLAVQSGKATINHCNLVLKADVIVSEAGSLTINDSDIRLNNRIVVYGTLNINNTDTEVTRSITSYDANDHNKQICVVDGNLNINNIDYSGPITVNPAFELQGATNALIRYCTIGVYTEFKVHSHSGGDDVKTIVENSNFNMRSGTIHVMGNMEILNTTTSDLKWIHNLENFSTPPLEGGSCDIIKVEYGGSLKVDGGTAGIEIDGGANFTWSETSVDSKKTYQLSNPKYTVTGSAIASKGQLTLDHVTITNVYSNTGGGAIRIGGGDKPSSPCSKNAKTHLNNCVIEKISAGEGAAIAVFQQSNKEDELMYYTDRNNCDVKVENSHIRYCISRDNENHWCGIIKTVGSAIGDFELINSKIYKNYAEGGCSGVYWNAGASGLAEPVFYFGGKSDSGGVGTCELYDNITEYQGGGIRIEASVKFTSETIVRNNHARTIGGGVHIFGYAGPYIGSTVTFNYDLNSNLKIRQNTADRSGAGLAIEFYTTCSLGQGSTINANFNGAEISGNSVLLSSNADLLDIVEGSNVYTWRYDAGCGGGVAFYDRSDPEKNYKFNINFDDVTIANNKALTNGGGFYGVTRNKDASTNQVEVHLNGGSISGNEAVCGGGLYVKDAQVSSLDGSKYIVRIEDNEAHDNSGVANGGGIYIEGGDINLNSAEINRNKAINGAGVFINGGKLSLGSGNISSNVATLRGGGIYLYGPDIKSSETNTSEFSGGLIKDNVAYVGGGVAARGYVNIGFSNSSVENNIATNGGGIYLTNHAKLTFTNGIIRDNDAKTTGELFVGQTGYKASAANENIQGFGGGFFIGDNAEMAFNMAEGATLGIYGNMADNGGDDLFANGNATKLTLPAVISMTLKDYEVSISPGMLYWAEDYSTNDTEYRAGTNIIETVKNLTWTGENRRYRNTNYETDFCALDNSVAHNLDNKYVSLALGYTMLIVTIEKYGMKPGDCAIFKISQLNEKTSEYEQKMSLILTEADKVASGAWARRLSLWEGTWKVEEDNKWTWAYTPADGNTTVEQPRLLKVNESDKSKRVFTFGNVAKDLKVPHDESLKRNEIYSPDRSIEE